MVEDRIEDGHRIAELLASELDGLDTSPLEDVMVVNADPDAEPGDIAYEIQYEGQQIATVRLRPRAIVITAEPGWPSDAFSEGDGLRRTGHRELVVESGAAVKRAVDTLRDTLA